MINLKAFCKKIFSKKINVYVILLLLIIVVSIFFRFYNCPFRYGLGDETIREAVIGIEGAREKQAPLTGPFSSAGPFVAGPWLYYQMIVASFIFPFNYTPWIFMGFTSVLCILLLYEIGNKLENKDLGLILAFLGCLSPAMIIASTHLTSPNFNNVFVLLVFLIFIKLIQKEISYVYSFLFGILLGISINIHFQVAGLLVFVIFLLIYRYKKILYFLYAICGIFITFIPLLIFDLTNHWHNLRSILFYYIHGKETIYVPNRWLFYLRDFWPSYWGDVIGVPSIIAVIIMLFFIGSLIWLFYKKKLSIVIVLILSCFLIDFVQLRYYFGERSFGYLIYLRPFIFIFTGYAIYFVYKLIKGSRFKKLSLYSLIGILFLLSIFILPKSVDRLARDPFSMEMYRYVSLLEKTYPHSTFTVYKCFNPQKTSPVDVSNSVIFLLDKQKMLSSNGKKIGVVSVNCKLPNHVVDKNIIPTTPLIDFSAASKADINSAYWKQYTFKSIYEPTAHWWYKENLE